MTDPDITPRKPPRQRRSVFTVDAILEAATRVLARGGLAELTTNRVAEVAGVSIGSVYQYFPNKDALVAALIARAQDGFAAEVERLVEASATLPPRDVLPRFADFAVRQQYDAPLLAAALDAEETRLPVLAILHDAERRMLLSIEAFCARQGAADPAGAARDLFVITKALVEADIGKAGGPPADLANRIHGAISGYLAGVGSAVADQPSG